MARQHCFCSSRIVRSGFGFSLLIISALACGGVTRAQDDALTVAPISAVEPHEESGLRAYVTSVPSAPTPKVEPAGSAIVQQRSQIQLPIEHKLAFFWLDRKSLMYGLVLSGAEAFDGATTRYFIHHCSHCFESDPVSRLLLGTHPSWGKMIPMGIAEAAVSTYSYRRLSHSPNRTLRMVAPLVPVGLKNKYRCADPGYVVVGAVCVPAPLPVLSGVSNANGGGWGSRRIPL
jgi:hypothetical protein